MNVLENITLPTLDDAYNVIIGSVEKDLFAVESVTGHRTYRADGHYWTSVDCWDSVDVCSDDCLIVWSERDGGWPVELETDVEWQWEHHVAPTFLDPATMVEAVAYPFNATGQDPYGRACVICDRLMFASPKELQFIAHAFDGYVECALWSTSVCPTDDPDETPEPLDADYESGDIHQDTLDEMLTDVVGFVSEYWGDVSTLHPGSVGHDFWLTREGHGAGFWDRGLGVVGDRLTEACKSYGGYDLYIGDDGMVHGQ